MTAPIVGLHHVTAIAGEPQANVDFYMDVLGLRLVKRTVNFDAPDTYHLYYGDEVGDPGTILTFFPWPGAPKGRRGTGQVTVTSFAIPVQSIGYWTDRLTQRGVKTESIVRRFDEDVLTLYDPDGLRLELVAHATAPTNRPWSDGPVPVLHAIRGFHGSRRIGASSRPSCRRFSCRPLQRAEMRGVLSFVHEFVPATSRGAPTLLLLHGTGQADE